MALNDRQLRFVEAYVRLGVATKAAIEAGYSEATAYAQGSRLLKDAEIRRAVDDRQANLANELGLTRQWVLDGLAAEAMDGDSPAAARIKARELVGKAHGMWVERAQIETSGMVEYTLNLGSPLGEESVDDEAEG